MISLQLNQKDLARITKATNSILYRAEWWTEKDGGELCRLGALGYSRAVINKINARKSPSPPYSQKYAKWKQKYGRRGYPSPWRLSGDVITSITYFKEATSWFGGIKGTIVGSGIKKPRRIVKYARVEEKRRSVLRPTFEDYKKSEWPELGKNALEDVANAWK